MAALQAAASFCAVVHATTGFPVALLGTAHPEELGRTYSLGVGLVLVVVVAV